MKLLVLVNDFPDSEDRYIANMFVKEQAKSLSNYVEEINVLVPVPYGLAIKRRKKYSNYRIKNINIYFIRYLNPLFFLFIKFGKVWVNFEIKSLIKFIKNKKINFDLIHAHYSWPSGAVAIELKKRYGVPVIITEHTSITLNKLLSRGTRIAFKTWKNTDGIICVSRTSLDKLLKALTYETKLYYITNGFDKNKFINLEKKIARERLNLLDKKHILLTVGRLSSEKGQIHLIEAIKLLSNTDIKCIFIGDGPLRKSLQKRIDELRLSDNVRLIGSKPHAEISLWLNAADFFVLPSLHENMPTVMFEALAVGLPFVGTKVGGVPEIITSEDYGLLVEPGNAKDLADKIQIALNKEWDREKIREYAQQFTWDNIARQILEVYKEVLNKN